ncbi:hypothetical protein V2S66_06910 [Streptomyces sp. V4-01]|uniref:DUF4351 domain-containing protein n=1 Tax=Actinacidiphila polyblastidii TaxID=3110430 RepID=A0ABU7P7A2_9ACTN|nr:hypothetical protein [Streptomyces sp. V4-01]
MSEEPNPPIPTSFFRSETAERVRDEGRVEGREEGLARGRAEGQAAAILRVLERRSLHVSRDVRERIAECADLALLGVWFDRAFDVERAEDLFAED